MRLIAFGGDERMLGVLQAAQQAGWETVHIAGEDDVPEQLEGADAVMLPWPRSFRDDRLVAAPGAKPMNRERVLSLIPPCRVAVAGGVEEDALPMVQRLVRPEKDEAFLRKNAQLTAEGAVLEVLRRRRHALLESTAMITGFGRIGQEMAVRLCALGMFVIVCARSESQMHMAHGMGAHPVPLRQIASACAQADVVINTVPARVLNRSALEQLRRHTPIIELASAPYGLDLEEAVQMGLEVAVESGLPGRYAPLDAGKALFEALLRGMEIPSGRPEETQAHEAGKGENSHG